MFLRKTGPFLKAQALLEQTKFGAANGTKATTLSNNISNSIGTLCKTPSTTKTAVSNGPRYCFLGGILAELPG